MFDLDDKQAQVLFDSECAGVRGKKGYALAACERIDKFIKEHKGD